jgi:phosphoribosylamine--glycine ligase
MSDGKFTLLVLGSGGREHALCWRIAHEGHRAICAPGSQGIAQHAQVEGVALNDVAGLIELAKRESVDAVIVGPEQPLVDGVADALREAGVPVVGPSAAAAELEGSKAAAKTFMEAHGVPTAKYLTVDSLEAGLAALEEFDTPPVVKASGLAAGKGVTVCETREEAEAALRECMGEGRFGDAGSRVVLEERLHGQEASFFALCDGETYVTFAPCQDHKRLLDGDQGPNTGGMGAYAPAPVCTEAVYEKVIERVLKPSLAGLVEEGRPFNGIMFIGLMIDDAGDPKVIEYNVRFGDPETQPLMLGLRGEVVPKFVAAARGELESGRMQGSPACTVVLASAGYPRTSTKGVVLEGLDAASAVEGVQIFHAGSLQEEGRWLTNGGRVLGICAQAEDLPGAVARAYQAVDAIRSEGAQVRRDIAYRALGK